MAQLFVARRLDAPHELVVIKRVLPALGCDHEFVRMFEKEARIGRTLEHPNIARVIASGLHDGAPYMVVEYVHGVDLRRLLKQAVVESGALPMGVALGIGVEIAKALQYAHEHAGVVHRDVDPTNVLVADDGAVKLVDFGIARTMASTHTTRASWVKGKAGYMAPEQCLGEHLDPRTDVFALGILLYEMTTGYRLFHGSTDYETTSSILAGEYVRPSEAVNGYPPQLEAVIVRALEREPDQRWASAEDLRIALAEFALAANVSLDRTERARRVVALLEPLPTPASPAPRSQLRNAVFGALLAVPVAAAALTMARSDSAPTPAMSGSPPQTQTPTPGPIDPRPNVVSEHEQSPEPTHFAGPEAASAEMVAQPPPTPRTRAAPRKRTTARPRRKQPAEPAPPPSATPVAPRVRERPHRPADTILPPSWTGQNG